jgi:four helix bundle protein
MDKEFSFEKLVVWQEAKKLTIDIYTTIKKFPKEELYGLSSQLKRAANSVNSNIAEGSARHTNKDQAKFYTIAFSSLIETLNHIIIAFELKYISADIYGSLRQQILHISYKLSALRKSTLK